MEIASNPPAIDTTNVLSQASQEYINHKLEQHKKLQDSEEEEEVAEQRIEI